MLASLIDDSSRFDAVVKPLHRQAFIVEFGVEAFCRPVLLGLARIDQRNVEILACRPFEQRLSRRIPGRSEVSEYITLCITSGI